MNSLSKVRSVLLSHSQLSANCKTARSNVTVPCNNMTGINRAHWAPAASILRPPIFGHILLCSQGSQDDCPMQKRPNIFPPACYGTILAEVLCNAKSAQVYFRPDPASGAYNATLTPTRLGWGS